MKKIYLSLFISLLVIGFAAVATNLIIDGTINFGFNQEQFEDDVIFTKAETEAGGSATIAENKKSISYESRVLLNLNDTTTLNFEVSNYSVQYDAKVKLNCSIEEDNPYTEYIDISYSLNESEVDGYTIIAAGTRKSGKLETTLIKTYAGTEEPNPVIDVVCEISSEPLERDSVAKELVDSYNVGDEVTFKGEPFFVINNQGDKYTLLSKYNLNVAENKQYDNTATTDDYKTAFSSSTYWTTDPLCADPSGCDVNEIVSDNATAVNAAKNYATSLDSSAKGRLLGYLEALGLEDQISDIIFGKYVDQGYLKYWTSYGSTMAAMAVDGSSNYYAASFYSSVFDTGVRPVIEISKSLL